MSIEPDKVMMMMIIIIIIIITKLVYPKFRYSYMMLSSD